MFCLSLNLSLITENVHLFKKKWFLTPSRVGGKRLVADDTTEVGLVTHQHIGGRCLTALH